MLIHLRLRRNPIKWMLGWIPLVTRLLGLGLLLKQMDRTFQVDCVPEGDRGYCHLSTIRLAS
jgi:hypothetical protein